MGCLLGAFDDVERLDDCFATLSAQPCRKIKAIAGRTAIERRSEKIDFIRKLWVRAIRWAPAQLKVPFVASLDFQVGPFFWRSRRHTILNSIHFGFGFGDACNRGQPSRP